MSRTEARVAIEAELRVLDLDKANDSKTATPTEFDVAPKRGATGGLARYPALVVRFAMTLLLPHLLQRRRFT